MQRLVLLLLVVMAMLPSVISAQTPEATPSDSVHPSCHELDDYRETVAAVYNDLDEEDRLAFDMAFEKEPVDMRPSELRSASAAFDAIATKLERVPDDDVPFAAQAFHRSAIEVLSVWSSVFNALATSGPLGALAYGDAIEEANRHLEVAHTLGKSRCNDLWDTHMGDLLVPGDG